MTKFIKLNEVWKNDTRLTPMLINVNSILSVKKGNNGADTHINCGTDKYFFVKESVEEVHKLILGE